MCMVPESLEFRNIIFFKKSDINKNLSNFDKNGN